MRTLTVNQRAAPVVPGTATLGVALERYLTKGSQRTAAVRRRYLSEPLRPLLGTCVRDVTRDQIAAIAATVPYGALQPLGGLLETAGRPDLAVIPRRRRAAERPEREPRRCRDSLPSPTPGGMKLRWENQLGNDGTGFTTIPANPRPNCECPWCEAAATHKRLWVGASWYDQMETFVLIEGAHDARRIMLTEPGAPQFDISKCVELILRRRRQAPPPGGKEFEPLPTPAQVRAAAECHGFEVWPARQRAPRSPAPSFAVRSGWIGVGPDGVGVHLGPARDALRLMSAPLFSVDEVYRVLYSFIGLAAH